MSRRPDTASVWTGTAVVAALVLSGAVASAQARPLPPNVTPDMVQRGDAIFHGPGRCFKCHGANAEGTSKAPALVAPKRWINIHGDYPEIVQLVTNGVPEPKEHTAPMPQRGNSKISDQDVRDVAAYVWSISH